MNLLKEVKSITKSMEMNVSVRDNIKEIRELVDDIEDALVFDIGIAGDDIHLVNYGDNTFEVYRYGPFNVPNPPEQIIICKCDNIMEAMIAVGQEVMKLRVASFILTHDEYESADFEMDAVKYINGW